MARIDIEIEEYLDEVRTVYLVRELIQRHDFKEELEKEQSRMVKETEKKFYEIPVPEFKDSDQLLKYIKRVLGLREWHDKKRIIQEIESL